MMFLIRAAHPEVTVTSNASGYWGCDAYMGCSGSCCANSSSHITVKELAPIVVAGAIWGSSWRGKAVRMSQHHKPRSIKKCQGDAVNEVPSLHGCQVGVSASSHLGTDNTLADALSRDNLSVFRSLHPQAEEQPTALPAAMLDLILLREPDWTSRNWTGQWSSTFRMASSQRAYNSAKKRQ